MGQVRGWIDAMRPELGLRDEVADLIVLAWAALRQRAWYQHGSSIPAPRPGAARPDMELRPEPLPVPADWQAATSRAEVLFGIRVNPYLTAAGVAEFTESLRGTLDAVADPAAALAPRVELAYQHLGLPADRPGRLATARAGAALVESLAPGQQPGAPGRGPGPDRAARHGHGGGELAEPGAGRWPRRWTRSGGTGSAPLRAAEDQADERGRAAARVLTDAARGGGGRRVRDPAGTGSVAAPTTPSSTGCPPASPPAGAASASRRPDDVPIHVPPRPSPGRAGRATRAKGAPASEVLEPLDAFLDAHRDEQVVVEWRVQE